MRSGEKLEPGVTSKARRDKEIALEPIFTSDGEYGGVVTCIRVGIQYITTYKLANEKYKAVLVTTW